MTQQPDYTIYCDGGARGNPGPAAYGFVIHDKNGSKVYEEGRAIGNNTNNVAEYSAVVAALKYILSLQNSTTNVNFFLDSQLVTEQLSGRWKIKNENLRGLYFTVKELERKIGADFYYSYIPREKNHEADRLVNLALDSQK